MLPIAISWLANTKACGCFKRIGVKKSLSPCLVTAAFPSGLSASDLEIMHTTSFFSHKSLWMLNAHSTIVNS
jgi:hypothetical protein